MGYPTAVPEPAAGAERFRLVFKTNSTVIVPSGVLALGRWRLAGAALREVPVHRGPIVLITIDALRADTVGAFGGPPKVMPAL